MKSTSVTALDGTLIDIITADPDEEDVGEAEQLESFSVVKTAQERAEAERDR